MGLNRRHAELLEARGLDIELLERLGVGDYAKRGYRILDFIVELDCFLFQTEVAENGCWVWLGAARRGYGRYNTGELAHRISYALFVGKIPSGLTIDHICENKICVNPDHLEPVTIAENNHRRWRRHPKKFCAKGHPLTEDNTYARRRADGYIHRACKTCHREESLARYHNVGKISRQQKRRDARKATTEVL